jgi:hypothetical protein
MLGTVGNEDTPHTTPPLLAIDVPVPERMAKGFNLLRAMGWTPGMGLGKQEDGRTLPVPVSHCPEGLGLGYNVDIDEEGATPSCVVVIMQLPSNFGDEECLNLALPWGPVIEYKRDQVMRQMFVRLSTADQARDMVDYYQEHQLSVLGGHDLAFALGPRRFTHGKVPLVTQQPSTWTPTARVEAATVEAATVEAAAAPIPSSLEANPAGIACEHCGMLCKTVEFHQMHVSMKHAPCKVVVSVLHMYCLTTCIDQLSICHLDTQLVSLK